jgi:hypothetical protein
MVSAPQDNLREEGDAAQDNLTATSCVPADNAAYMGSASLSPRNKGKRRRRASSGGAQGNLPSARGPRVAGAMRRAKGKQNTGSSDANPSFPEGNPDEPPREGRDRDAGPRMYTGFADGIHYLLNTHIMR